VQPGSAGGFQKLFFGKEEIAIPVYGSTAEAAAKHPKADVFINYASFRSASESSMDALKQATVRVAAIIAEGVPERDAKALIAYARAHNKVIVGPATVGGVQAGAFKIGDTAGTLDNIVACKLYRPGSVGFVSKSGGMSNELYNVLARATDGLYEGIAIGGDSFPGSTLSDHCIRYQVWVVVVVFFCGVAFVLFFWGGVAWLFFALRCAMVVCFFGTLPSHQKKNLQKNTKKRRSRRSR
jgi:ATP citrate (pro-S)-lyase